MRQQTLPLLLAFSLLLPVASHAASFNCAKAKLDVEKLVCNTSQLSNLDDLLAVSFKKALATSTNPKTLKTEQEAWLSDERNSCSDVACIKEAYTSRIAALNEGIANAKNTPSKTTQTATTTGWYKVIAQPNLVVRSKPDVTGDKLGNIPTGGKVQVLTQTGMKDSIGGRNGQWLKIQWQDKTAYAFSAFLEPLTASTATSDDQASKHTIYDSLKLPTDKTLQGTIVSYECGDNCYLNIKDDAGEEHSGLCTATLCETWNAVSEMPAKYKGRRVKITVGTGTQYDNSGNDMGEMDSYDTIKLLD